MKKLLPILTSIALVYGVPALAVDSADFKAKTTRNLVNLCSVTWGDEQYEAAMGFCLGFLDAAQDYHRTITSGDLVKPIIWRLIRANCRYSFLLLFHVSNDRFSFLSRLNSICKKSQ